MNRLLAASLAILALALAFYLGTQAVEAQTPGQFSSITFTGDGSHQGYLLALTTTGEVYRALCGYQCGAEGFPTWEYWGAIYGTTPAKEATWGQIKSMAK